MQILIDGNDITKAEFANYIFTNHLTNAYKSAIIGENIDEYFSQALLENNKLLLCKVINIISANKELRLVDLLYLAGSSQPPYIKTYKLLFENSHLIQLHYKYEFIRSGLIAVLQHGHLELCRYLLEEKNINFADFKINATEIINSNEIRFSLTLEHIRYFLEKRLLADGNEELRNLLLCQNIQNVNYIDIAEYFKGLGCMLDKADLVEVLSKRQSVKITEYYRKQLLKKDTDEILVEVFNKIAERGTRDTDYRYMIYRGKLKPVWKV